jgi:hypothetical protein
MESKEGDLSHLAATRSKTAQRRQCLLSAAKQEQNCLLTLQTDALDYPSIHSAKLDE